MIRNKDTDTGYRLFAGYKINENFAVEGGYVNFGKFNVSANTLPAGTAGVDLKASVWTLDALGMLPTGSNFSVLGRFGILRSEVKADLSASGAVGLSRATSFKATKTSYDFGVGVQCDINRTVGVRAEWQRFKDLGDSDTTGKGDADLLSLGVLFRF